VKPERFPATPSGVASGTVPPQTADEYSLQFMTRVITAETDNLEFRTLRMMSAVEHEQVASAVRTLSEYVQGLDAFWTIALEDLTTTMDVVAADILSDLSGFKNVESWKPKITYRLLSLSIALRMYEEYVNAHVRRPEGKTGPIGEAVKAEFSRTYDTSPHYRILYALRNSLAHGSTRAIEVEGHVTVDAMDDEGTSFSLEVRLNREAFVSNSPKLKVEILALTVDPDVITIVERVAGDIRRLNNRVKDLIFPEALDASRVIGRYIAEVLAVGGDAPLFMTTEPTSFEFDIGRGLDLNHISVSGDVMAQARVQLDYDLDPDAERWKR
jgi:hypothetical protein